MKNGKLFGYLSLQTFGKSLLTFQGGELFVHFCFMNFNNILHHKVYCDSLEKRRQVVDVTTLGNQLTHHSKAFINKHVQIYIQFAAEFVPLSMQSLKQDCYCQTTASSIAQWYSAGFECERSRLQSPVKDRLLDSLVVECWLRVPASIPSQGPRHTKDVIKMVPVVPLFIYEGLRMMRQLICGKTNNTIDNVMCFTVK